MTIEDLARAIYARYADFKLHPELYVWEEAEDLERAVFVDTARVVVLALADDVDALEHLSEQAKLSDLFRAIDALARLNALVAEARAVPPDSSPAPENPPDSTVLEIIRQGDTPLSGRDAGEPDSSDRS